MFLIWFDYIICRTRSIVLQSSLRDTGETFQTQEADEPRFEAQMAKMSLGSTNIVPSVTH